MEIAGRMVKPSERSHLKLSVLKTLQVSSHLVFSDNFIFSSVVLLAIAQATVQSFPES